MYVNYVRHCDPYGNAFYCYELWYHPFGISSWLVPGTEDWTKDEFYDYFFSGD